MRISRNDLVRAAAFGLVDSTQVDRLWNFLIATDRSAAKTAARFSFNHVLYYLGGMIAIGAMSLFMTLGFEKFGGAGVLAIAGSYLVACVIAAEYLFKRRELAIAGGIVATLAIVLVPLAIYGLQHALGWWSGGFTYRDYHTHIDWRWMLMELATLASAAVALWRYRAPFLVLPVAVTLWYLSMDLAPFLAQGTFFAGARAISIGFGLAIVGVAIAVDWRARDERDFAFWLHIFGALTFWGALSLSTSSSELAKLGYALVNVILIFAGALLDRRVFAVLGGLGLAGYLGHLARRVFADSWLFPVALSLLGLAIVGLGILWQRHAPDLGARMRAALPRAMREGLGRVYAKPLNHSAAERHSWYERV